MIKNTRITFQTEGDMSVGIFPTEVTVDVGLILAQAEAEDLAKEIAEYLDEGPATDIDVTHAERSILTEIERLRTENANLKRLLDDANERAAQIEDWQIKCALLEVDRDKARAENAALAGEREAVEQLLLDNGYGGAGFASLADAIDATLGELRRLEAKSKALRAECSDLWEVIERTKDALRDYDGICLEGAQGAWEILQGALDEEPTDGE